MTVTGIYTKYGIPDNLQQHMLRVAAVGTLVCEGIGAAVITSEIVIKTLLLHDLGNVLKMDFKKLDWLSERDKKRVGELEEMQAVWRQRYGMKADEATLALMAEMGIDEDIVRLCATSHGEHLPEMLDGGSLEQKVCFYADMRIGPFGILPLKARFDDLIRRYPKEAKRQEHYYRLSLTLEKQIQEVCSLDLQQIETDLVEDTAQSLRMVEIV